MIFRAAVLISLLLSAASGAAENLGSWLTESTLNETEIFAATYDACSKTPRASLYGGLEFDRLRAGQFPSKRFNRLILSIFSEEFKKNTVYLLDDRANENELWLLYSNSFRRALAECYSDPADRVQFTRLISQRKTAGKVAGVFLSMVALTKGMGAFYHVRASLGLWVNRVATSSALLILSYDVLRKLAAKVEVRVRCGSPAALECVTKFLEENPADAAELKNAADTELGQVVGFIAP